MIGQAPDWRSLRILVVNAEDPAVSTRETGREFTSVLRELDLQIVDASSATVDGSDASARPDEAARKPKPRPT